MASIVQAYMCFECLYQILSWLKAILLKYKVETDQPFNEVPSVVSIWGYIRNCLPRSCRYHGLHNGESSTMANHS